MNIIQHGFVTDNQDPDRKGRIKMELYLSDVETESGWIPVLQGFSGDDTGVYCLPEVGDSVVAAFMDNSYSSGFVLGGITPLDKGVPASEENTDADFNDDGNNALRMIKSKSGQRIILDDTDGAEKIQILNPDGKTRIELNGEDESINFLTDKDITINGETKVSITAEEMEIKLDKDLTIECDNLGLKAGGSGEVKASNSVTIEGQSVGIN